MPWAEYRAEKARVKAARRMRKSVRRYQKKKLHGLIVTMEDENEPLMYKG